ncbi:MAG: PIN domain-containing protein [Sulfuricurvum sp.]
MVIGHIETMFRLPYTFAVPDILYFEELQAQHSELPDYGLEVLELSSEAVGYAMSLSGRYNGPGMNDLFALALAREHTCPLLTGDNDLRRAADEEGVVLYGTIWIIEHMVRHRFVTIAEAHRLIEELKEKKRRLPWDVARAHLYEFERELGLET